MGKQKTKCREPACCARLTILVGLCSALTAWAPAAWATTFAVQPLEQLIYDSPTILRGQVVSSTSDWGQGGDGGKRIYTYTEIELKEAFKAPSGQTYRAGQMVRIRELGGEKEGITMSVPGSAHFEKGEDAVVLLGNAGADGSLEVRGMSTGKYEVTQDEKGNEYLTGGMLSLAQTDTTLEKSAMEWPLQKLRETVITQRSKPPAPLPAGPLRTVTVHDDPKPQLAQPLQSPSREVKDDPQGESNAQGRAKGQAWKWVLGVMLGGFGYAWMRRRS